MDDARIQKLTNEVLASLGDRDDGPEAGSLERRIAALEAEVTELRQRLSGGVPAAVGTSAPSTVAVSVHPSFQVLNVGESSSRCILEPDKPCTDSGQCRSLGH